MPFDIDVFQTALATVTAPVLIKKTVSDYWQKLLNKHSEVTADHPFMVACAAQAEQILRCWSGSDFVAQQCIQDPTVLKALLQSPQLRQSHSTAVNAMIEQVESETQLIHQLRLYRYQQMARIVWLDQNRLAATAAITQDLSALASACINGVLHWLYEDSCKAFGTPYGQSFTNKEAVPQKMVVLGMGKLGAKELNLSSDIDLIFAYPCKGETQGSRRSIDNQAFFTRLGQRLIKVLDQQTADGFVFRVDMRLRPYGASGALAMSFAAMEQYYQDQGRDWERYAMQKARVVAGDIHAGKQLLAQLKPFVYRRYIDFGAIDALRAMKQLIMQQVKRKGMDSNIKLGDGGIREVEFIIQSLQLIHGGRNLSLQRRNTIKALHALIEHHHYEKKEGAALEQAYLFLRNVEHSLQAYADKQTQSLPQESKQQLRLAFALGYSDWSDFEQQLTKHRQVISQQFAQGVAGEEDSEADSQSEWHAFWQGLLNSNEEKELLYQHGFTHINETWQQLVTLRDGKAITRIGRQSRDRVDGFLPILLEVASQSNTPDLLVARLLPLVEAVLRRTAYLVLLMENRAALQHLATLCIESPWIAAQITRHPALLDEFLDIGELYHPPQKSVLEDELRQLLTRIPEDDLELQMDTLRYFKMTHILRVMAAHVAGTLPLMKESDYLTWIAEVILNATLAIAWRDLTHKYGFPPQTNNSLDHTGFIIIGYGKLGGIELGPASDLDLVLLHNGKASEYTDGARSINSETFYARLGQRIIHMLTTQTTSGALYDVDMRLRPNGNKGLLVSSFVYFEKYQRKEAWVWEHQALIRARPLAGDAILSTAFIQLRATILQQARNGTDLKASIIEMRDKMLSHKKKTAEGFDIKQDRGGIIDIEFLVQYLVLKHCHTHLNVQQWTDNIRISEDLEQASLISAAKAKLIQQAYQAYRLEVHKMALQNRAAITNNAKLIDLQQQIATLWQDYFEE